MSATQTLLGDVPATALDVVVGIDPGAHAAGNLLWIEDTPSTPEANGRIATNAPLLASILARSHARIAYCEFVGARPTDAKVAAFAFGRARGCIEGVCAALSIPIVFVAPVWKRLANIPPGVENKDLARTRAIARWPAHADLFKRRRDLERAAELHATLERYARLPADFIAALDGDRLYITSPLHLGGGRDVA